MRFHTALAQSINRGIVTILGHFTCDKRARLLEDLRTLPKV